MPLSVFEIFNRDSVFLEHLYEAQDGLQIDIAIFNHYVYQYMNERFNCVRLELQIRRGIFSGVNREVYSVSQPPGMEHILIVRVRDFF